MWLFLSFITVAIGASATIVFVLHYWGSYVIRQHFRVLHEARGNLDADALLRALGSTPESSSAVMEVQTYLQEVTRTSGSDPFRVVASDVIEDVYCIDIVDVLEDFFDRRGRKLPPGFALPRNCKVADLVQALAAISFFEQGQQR